MTFKLGILDFGYRDTTSPTDILRDVMEYACAADQLKFSSYWMGEHHNSGRAWSNPEVLIPLLAAMTKKINVGMAGVLLAAHSPYRVALNYKLLSNLFPGRIDLGVANGKVKTDIAKRLLSNEMIDDSFGLMFDKKVAELLTYLGDEALLFENNKLIIPPVGGLVPRIWKLSVSFKGLPDCIPTKMNFCKSLFHVKMSKDETIDKNTIPDFRNAFFQKYQSYPSVSVAFAGICDKTSQSARKTANNLKIFDNNNLFQSIVGCPSYFREKLCELNEKFGATEFVFYDMTEGFNKRMKGIELLAKEFH